MREISGATSSARLGRRARTILRSAVCALLALLVLESTLGLGITPAWLARQTRLTLGERYPCEGGRCGCASAEYCWTECRCQPLAMKLAWAQREGVPVPVSVERSAQASADNQPACPLCVDAEDDQSSATETADAGSPTPAHGLPTLTPAGCRGIEMLIAGAGVCFIRVTPAWSRAIPIPDGGSVVPASRAFPQRVVDVPVPPPRA